MNPKFILFDLCNNDYGQHLEKAAQIVHAHLEGDILVSERRIKEVVVNLVLALADLQWAARGFSTSSLEERPYLEKSLKVIFQDTLPNVDHDGGSAAIDRNLNYIWRY